MAGIPKKLAPTIGIAVDHRRRNRSEESLALNSKRLKAYKASLILFPRRTAKPKHGDSEAGELSMAKQLKGKLMPITKETKPLEMVAVTGEMKDFKAYQTLRTERIERAPGRTSHQEGDRGGEEGGGRRQGCEDEVNSRRTSASGARIVPLAMCV